VLGWSVATALASPSLDEFDQQIIVWGDPFLRWDQRFYVETEVRPIVPLRLASFYNDELRVTSLQVRAVLDCERFATQGTHQLEVRCRIEDISLRGRGHRRDDEPRHARVLPELDATLTGLQIELQVTDEGRVLNLGLEGMTTTVRRTRQRQELLRQIAWYLLAPFDLKLPDPIRPVSRWTTYQSPLFDWPSQTSTQGSAQINHYMNPVEEHLLVQTLGRAHIQDRSTLTGVFHGYEDEAGSMESAIPFAFDLRLDGVALFDPANGILVERVYSVHGQSTSSSAASVVTRHYSHNGRLTMLGSSDRPDLGESALVSREEWVPMAVYVEASDPPSP